MILAAVDAGILSAVGVPLPLLWGLLAFITLTAPDQWARGGQVTWRGAAVRLADTLLVRVTHRIVAIGPPQWSSRPRCRRGRRDPRGGSWRVPSPQRQPRRYGRAPAVTL